MKLKASFLWDVHYQIEGAPLAGKLYVVSDANYKALKMAVAQVKAELQQLRREKKIPRVPKVEGTAAFIIGNVLLQG